MFSKNESQLMEGAITSLICDSVLSNFSYQHRLLSNRNEKIITTLRNELEECDEFLISVAFITEGGIALILQQLKKLQNKKTKGKIITGDYLNFTQPKALKKLLSFENIELKMVKGENLHAKGFFFRKGDMWNMIVGSSNLTGAALTTNLEWNIKISSLENGKIAKEILGSFLEIYNNLDILSEKELLDYEKLYLETKKRLNYDNFNREIEYNKKPVPNLMQREALQSLKKLREENHEKALLISATGTGKTYLSAFDVAEYRPKKLLFIAHRKNILTKSKKSFKNLIPDRRMEIFDPGKSNEGDFIFAMIQTLSRDEHLKKIPQDYFDYIIVDEVHHSGADTYQKVIQYFKPKFLLGMTATPERSDDFDIYRLFNNTIAYEIRLHDALKEKLLCPFHYFGIRDITQNGESISQKSNIKDLTSDTRIKNILEQTEYYGYSGPKLHGLIFVSNVKEARELSILLNEKGLLTKALTGEDSEAVREKAIQDLTEGRLQYLITVDIFNEGIDIPCVNQVVLLRPTESAIVYIQQLGRGLRKDHKKEFVVILDFIGNYEKNFLIPTAISQNNSYDKDFMKRFISRGTDLIPGESSLVFEEIVKDEIFKNINKTNFSTKKNIEHDYNLLKKQLGRTPYLLDFFRRNMIDPSVILKYRKDYNEILEAIDKNSLTEAHKLTKEEKNYLKFLSQFFTPAKRIHDFFILKELLSEGKVEIG
ncbi:MAG: DEAD/DEAH box helicase family protein, partial [Fusobacteriaceae bacterium]